MFHINPIENLTYFPNQLGLHLTVINRPLPFQLTISNGADEFTIDPAFRSFKRHI
jgi:hypothetical protein